MIQFPPMETFDDGELQDGKKLAKKILEEDVGELLQVLRHHRQ